MSRPESEQSVQHGESGAPMYLIETGPEPVEAGARSTIGGRPFLPAGEPWPSCYCGARMMLFFQLDIPAELPIFGGDHLLVFQCPDHTDGFGADGLDSDQLPEQFWDRPPLLHNAGVFWRILLHRDDAPAAESDPYLRPSRLVLRLDAETLTESGRGRREFKVGGVPSWIQDPEHYRCACGAELAYVCEVPENRSFAGQLERPDHLDSHYGDSYVLFLGNEVYILACTAHCHPAAAWPVMHN